ncbi:hypothetical protein NQL31_002341 [Lotmaria passim]
MMNSATSAEPQHQVLQLTCRDLHMEVPSASEPRFTIEAAQPFTCETATVSTSTAVSVHRGGEMTAQQRVPLGARKVGTIHIRAANNRRNSGRSDSASENGETYSVPLYQARVAYRRPNVYKERASLCIVDDGARHSWRHGSCHHWPNRQRSRPNAMTEEKADAMRVCFVDLVSLTFLSRVSLRCVRTGELLTPIPLFCRYDVSSTKAAAAASNSSGVSPKTGATEAAELPSSRSATHAHAQHHRRRVVLLPPSAAGETYELVAIITKRVRDGEDRQQ